MYFLSHLLRQVSPLSVLSVARRVARVQAAASGLGEPSAAQTRTGREAEAGAVEARSVQVTWSLRSLTPHAGEAGHRNRITDAPAAAGRTNMTAVGRASKPFRDEKEFSTSSSFGNRRPRLRGLCLPLRLSALDFECHGIR